MASRDLPTSSLLNQLHGYGASDIRRAVGSSHAANIAHLEGLVERARRHTALYHKHPKGASAGELRIPVTFDENGHLQMRSLQPTLLIVDGDPEGNPHQVVWDIDIAVLRPLLEIPEPCDCCWEDVAVGVIIVPDMPIALIKGTDPCRLILRLPCDPCGQGVVTGGF